MPEAGVHERSKVCVTGAYRFRHLGQVERELTFASPIWSSVGYSAEIMEESLDQLAACDPELPVGELKRLVAQLRDAARKKHYSEVARAVHAIEDIFDRMYVERAHRW
jgi:hypothetical protein